jgi:hypothetical protein
VAVPSAKHPQAQKEQMVRHRIVGNELKHVPDYAADKDITGYFDNLIKKTEGARMQDRFSE